MLLLIRYCSWRHGVKKSLYEPFYIKNGSFLHDKLNPYVIRRNGFCVAVRTCVRACAHRTIVIPHNYFWHSENYSFISDMEKRTVVSVRPTLHSSLCPSSWISSEFFLLLFLVQSRHWLTIYSTPIVQRWVATIPHCIYKIIILDETKLYRRTAEKRAGARGLEEKRFSHCAYH